TCHSSAQCTGDGGPVCFVQYETTGAHLSKCEYREYTNQSLPRIKYYHHQEIHTLDHYEFRQSGTNGYELPGDGCYNVTASDGPYLKNITDDTDFTEFDDSFFYTNYPCFLTNSY